MCFWPKIKKSTRCLQSTVLFTASVFEHWWPSPGVASLVSWHSLSVQMSKQHIKIRSCFRPNYFRSVRGRSQQESTESQQRLISSGLTSSQSGRRRRGGCKTTGHLLITAKWQMFHGVIVKATHTEMIHLNDVCDAWFSKLWSSTTSLNNPSISLPLMVQFTA